ncbi:ABC transporter ATP-binding protein/permease [Photorhabdus temperata]|uniref:ABC-type multidrug transport system, ATPase and permease component n=1 Tax=Photorhabdus temperata subsp. temperata Meg1 TaxID=1393735 RepID=A0A081RZ73_PHOTE|nr:ABC transporter ATP-binding protein [Photorhabdus temperata]KER03976.1 ABC-type multidrug transport system, ATPase and permease component [Photorhabdus temperata subsp. temperata Meg1]MCT8347114.1 ABC transporter ATP-binding protein/permease [Photorhabdus temperata]
MSKNLTAWQILLHSAIPFKGTVICAFLALIVTLLCDLGGPYIIRDYVDRATSGTIADQLIVLAIIYIFIALLGVIGSLVMSYMSTRAGWGIADNIRYKLFHHVITVLPVLEIERRSRGELLENVEGNADIIGKTISKAGFKAIGNLALALGTLIIIFSVMPQAGISMAVVVILVAYVLTKLTKLAVRRWLIARTEKARIFGFIGDSLHAMDDLQPLSKARWPSIALRKMLSILLKLERSAYIGGRAFWPITQLFFALCFGIGFGFGLQLLGQDSLSIGTLTMVYLYVDRLREPMEDMSSEVDQIQKLFAALSLAAKTLNEGNSGKSSDNLLPDGPLSIHFDNVDFSYHGEEIQVLHGVNFYVAPGSKIGIIGRTGAGKSTILNLICGFARPALGRVTIGNIDVSTIKPEEFAKKVSVLSQRSHLFSATLRENLTLFSDEISDAQIWDVLQELDALEWVRVLPDGLDTQVGANGWIMSEGQIQMIAGARVMLQHCPLVIIDEGTSQLDPRTEESWLKLLEKLSRNRTVVMVAHRLHTLAAVDEVIIINDGRVQQRITGSEIATLTNNHGLIV